MASNLFGKPTTTENKPFWVLVLDGGGMRGFYTAAVLQQLVAKFDDTRATSPKKKDLGAAFDLIVGTSTGGILGTALAAGMSPDDVCSLYEQRGGAIFATTVPSAASWELGPFALRFMRRAVNDGVALRTALMEVFSSETIGELYARRGIALCLPTTDMARHAPVVIKTGHLEGKHRDDATTLVEACLATSAAPILLPLAHIMIDGARWTMADGGLWANSPILVALIEATKLAGTRPIRMISVGTCPPPVGNFVDAGKGAWGIGQWRFGIGVTDTSLDAQSAAAPFVFDQLRPALCHDALLVRLHQTAPSADHQRLIGRDRADSRALQAMRNLAAADAGLIHGEIMTADSPLVFLREFFTTLPQAA